MAVVNWVSNVAVPDDVGVYLNHMLRLPLDPTTGSLASVVLPVLASAEDV